MSTITAKKGNSIIVDLDGTLIYNDSFYESVILLLKKNIFYVFLFPIWLFKGKAHLKASIANRVTVTSDMLVFHDSLLTYLKDEKLKGRSLVLATGSDQKIADEVTHHLGIFDQVLSSDGKTNLTGKNKLQRIKDQVGDSFTYAGNERKDCALWNESDACIFVSVPPSITKNYKMKPSLEFNRSKQTLFNLFKVIRVHQWVKNGLIFVPLLVSHQYKNLGMLKEVSWMFLSFCLCASALYIFNDLIDLKSDRNHITKRNRPIANCSISIPVAVMTSVSLLVFSTIIMMWISPAMIAALAVYVVLSSSYSLFLKKMAIVDVLLLSMLFTYRIILGHLVTGIAYSFWLLGFSVFIFFGLAVVKRFSELKNLMMSSVEGRGYLIGDINLLRSMAISSFQIAVLIFALYVSSDSVSLLYKAPMVLWLICPLFLFWFMRICLITDRGQMNEDPIVFALKDRVSYVLLGLIIIIALVARHGFFG